jgi:predicted CoA-binding protein
MRTDPAVVDFLARKRIAMVGVSRDPLDFTRGLFRELLRRGYDMVPVNPIGGSMEGLRCWQRVQDIVPPVEGALLMTPPDLTEQVVKDCAEAGITRVWMHRGIGPGAVSATAVAFCRVRGMSVVAGACPYMFLPRSGLVHRVHGFFSRGLYFARPAHAHADPARPA